MTDKEKAEILKSTEKLWNERNRLKELVKKNAELKAHIEELKNMASKQVDAVLELYDQIEKMKCCGNCKYELEKYLFPTMEEAEDIICDHCKNKSKWKEKVIEE